MPINTHPNTPKYNYRNDILLLLAVPLAVALITATLIYIPRLLAHPQYDFIYSLCDDYRCSNTYSVDQTGRISVVQDTTSSYGGIATLRYYDATNDSTSTITPEQANSYRLNSSSKSPDGYTLTTKNSQNGFLFWSENRDGWYLKNGMKQKSIDLVASGSYYARNINFLGWVTK